MDGERIFLNLGKVAGVLLATATIGGIAGYSCVIGVGVGINNIKRFEEGAADHVENVRAIIDTAARQSAEPTTKEQPKTPSETTKQQTRPAAPRSANNGPTMTARNAQPRTFAEEEYEPIKPRFKSYTYKADADPVVEDYEPRGITDEQREQLAQYLEEQDERIKKFYATH